MKFATEQEFVRAIFAYFGLNEALRSDQSYEAFLAQLEAALREWVKRPMDGIRVAFTFADRVVAYVYSEEGPRYRRVWEIPYTRDEAGAFVFGGPTEVKEIALFEPVTESAPSTGSGAGRKGQAFTETIEQVMESAPSASAGAGRKVKAIGITADVVNGNGRRYPRAVLAAAVAGLNSHLHESNGQGRLVTVATGEVEHPSDKGGRPNLLETVVKWNAASLDSAGKVLLEGVIIPTGKGKDISTLIEHGVPVGVSMRGFGAFRSLTEGERTIQEVTELTIKGFDLVAQPSDPNGQVVESQQPKPEGKKKTMTLEEMLKELQGNPAKLAEFLQANPALAEAVVGQLGYADKRVLAGQMGVSPARLEQSVQELLEAKRQLEEQQHAAMIEQAIQAECKALPYGKLNEKFIESVRAEKPQTAEQVLAIVESKVKEWDTLLSAAKLTGMGGPQVRVLGPVFERETGQPEFTRAAWEITENLITSGNGKRFELAKADFGACRYTRAVLKRFDEVYKARLMEESRQFNEAEQSSDLNLPYSVSRAIIEQAFPELIAANVFDFSTTDQAPALIFFESYTPESGSVVTVAPAAVTVSRTAFTAVPSAGKRLIPGTVTVTSNPAGTTYVEGVDYVIDYLNGTVMALTGGIANGASVLVGYQYDAIRKGELTAISRAKNTLTNKALNIAADRLATQITTEAIVFSRSQLGYDAVGRTLANLVRQIRRRIDKGVMYMALTASLQQASNSGGTWASASDPIAKLVEYVGVAKVKVENRFYEPTSILMSKTNADRLSNWDGFTAQGFPNAVLTSAGYAGSIKGLPIFASPEFPDSHVTVQNREVVMHRVYQPMQIKGPYPSYDNSGNLLAADQYYSEEFNGTDAPVVEKIAHVRIN